MHGVIPPQPIPPYGMVLSEVPDVFMVWYLVKHRDNFTFYLILETAYILIVLKWVVMKRQLKTIPEEKELAFYCITLLPHDCFIAQKKYCFIQVCIEKYIMRHFITCTLYQILLR